MICIHYWQLALLLLVVAVFSGWLGAHLTGRTLDRKNGSR